MKHLPLLTILMIALLLTGLMAAAQEEGPVPVGLRPDAPTYALHGPYWVGTIDLVIEDPDRPIPISVWYPALNPDNEEETVTYHPVLPWVPPPEVDSFIYGHALVNAAPDASDAPYPAVVFSHGYAAFPARYAYLVEHLASYGFVVLAPVHGEQFYFDDNPWRDSVPSTIDRPHDISKVLDYAEGLTGASGALEGLIDMNQVAVTGHSSGGFTALVAAGARLNLTAYNARCAESGSTPGLSDMMMCDVFVPNEAEMARLAGLDSMPEGLWPSMGDARVKAIVPMAGDGYMFGEAGLAEITIPMLTIGGTMDSMTWFDLGPRLAYDQVSSPQKSLVAIEMGEHHLFETSCTDSPWMYDFGWSSFCSDAVWDMDRAHDLVNHFTTAFLLDTLKGDTEAHTVLLAENVNFPGITYETTLK